MEIGDEVKSRLMEIAEEYNVPVEKLEQEYMEEYKEISKRIHSTRIAMKKALRRVKNKYSRTTEYIGFLIGMSDVVDRVEILKRIALRMWTEDREKAIAQGLCNPEGIPLDTRVNVRGRPNPRYGMPFKEDEHEYTRSIYGIVQTQEGWKPFRMTLSVSYTHLTLPTN